MVIMIEVLASIISAIITAIPLLNKGDSARKKEKTKKFLNIILTLLVVFVIGYVFFDIVRPTGSKKDYTTLSVRMDSVITYNRNITMKYDSLLVINRNLLLQVNTLTDRLNNYNLEKYPFSFSRDIIANTRSEQIELLNSIGASKITIGIFHNPIGLGFRPITSINGFKSYIFVSVVSTVTDVGSPSLDEVYFQNIPLNPFKSWFYKANSEGYAEFHENTLTGTDRILMNMILIDPDGISSFYLFGIQNYDNTKAYGQWIGSLFIDFGKKDKKMSRDEIDKVSIFCDDLSNKLSKYRRIE